MRGMAGWIVVRTMLVLDVMILVVVGFIALFYVSLPAGGFIAIAVWLIAGGLLTLLPLTDPYRVEERRRRRDRYGATGWSLTLPASAGRRRLVRGIGAGRGSSGGGEGRRGVGGRGSRGTRGSRGGRPTDR